MVKVENSKHSFINTLNINMGLFNLCICQPQISLSTLDLSNHESDSIL
jgi:hypothetical protein